MLPGRRHIARWLTTTCLIGAVAGAAILPGSMPALAQDTVTPIAPPQQAALPSQVVSPTPTFTQAQIDAMMAPIALYPDQLLGEMLMAATYPQEIVAADRWVHDPAVATLGGDGLAAALASIDWDPSVKSLVPFPQVLDLMVQHLDWTQELGTAFLAQQGQVMDAVQRLRAEALADGYLHSTPQLAVVDQGGAIVIEPVSPEVLYVPVYDPTVIYGPWPYPRPPVELYRPGAYAEPIVFSAGFVIVRSFWGWSRCDWSRHHMFVDPPRVNAINARLIEREHRPRVEAATWRVDPSRRPGGPAAGVASAVAPTQPRPQPGPVQSAPAALHQETPFADRHHPSALAPQGAAAVAPSHAPASPVPGNPRPQVDRPHPSPLAMPHPPIAAVPHATVPHVEARPAPAPHASPAPTPVAPPRMSMPHPAIAAMPHVSAPTPEARPHLEMHPGPARQISPAPRPVPPPQMSMPHPAIAAVPRPTVPHVEVHPAPAPHASPAPAPVHVAPQAAHAAPHGGAPDHKHP